MAAKQLGVPLAPDSSAVSDIAGPTAERQAGTAEIKPKHRLGEQGTSAGINIEPGSNDDGWEIPPPVMLEDGTRVQLYKDGEALHAGFDAIKEAKKRICLEVYIFHSDDTGWAFANLLSARARQGVPELGTSLEMLFFHRVNWSIVFQ